jgi:adenine-specific DNA methylase
MAPSAADAAEPVVGGSRRGGVRVAGFTNTAWHGTKMRRFNARGGQRPLTGTLYIPQLSSEVNVLEVLRNKVRQLVRYYNEFQPNGTPHAAIQVGSATRLVDLPDESVDYVFTDPPFGSNIFYSDCNIIAESWLGGITQNAEEMVVNRTLSPENGGKTFEDYEGLMCEALREIRRVLKPRAWATMVFHNTDSRVWRALQTAAAQAGFEIDHAAGLDRKQQSHKGYKGRAEKERVAHFDVLVSMRKTMKSAVRSRPRANPATLRALAHELMDTDPRVANSTQRLHSALLRWLVDEGYDLSSVDFRLVADLRNGPVSEGTAT